MTTFTFRDFVEEKDGSVTTNVEPIPFAGMVAIQDKEDTEAMLRHQLHLLNDRIKELEQELMNVKSDYDLDTKLLMKRLEKALGKTPAAWREMSDAEIEAFMKENR